MISSVEVQFLSLLIAVFAGIAAGLLFDLYRTVNYCIKPSKIFTHIMDLLFWVIAGCIVFSILLRAEFAKIRIYTFVGMSIGIFIYIKLFSEYVLKFCRILFHIIARIIRISIIIVILPFKLLYNLLWFPLVRLRRMFFKICKSIKGKVASLFKKKH